MHLVARFHVHGAELSTAVQRRHSFAWVEQKLSVESGLDGVKLRQLGGCELNTHFRQLLDADAVFTGNRAADLYTELQDSAAELLRAAELVVIVGVVGNQRV